MNLDFKQPNTLPTYWQVPVVYRGQLEFPRFRDSVLAYLNSMATFDKYVGLNESRYGAYYGVFPKPNKAIHWGQNGDSRAVTLTLDEFISAFTQKITKKTNNKMSKVKYHKDTPNTLPKNWGVNLGAPGRSNSVVKYLNSLKSRDFFGGTSVSVYGIKNGDLFCTTHQSTLRGVTILTLEEFEACFNSESQFKRGEKVLYIAANKTSERIYLDSVPGSRYPHLVVSNADEGAFKAGLPFNYLKLKEGQVAKLPKEDKIKVTVEINGESAALSDLNPEQLQALLKQED